MNDLEYVVNNNNYVGIDYEKLNSFIDNIHSVNYRHWFNDLDIKLDSNKYILLVFIIESMNFCFWKIPKWKIKYKDEIVSGSNALFYSIIREVQNNSNFLDINYLYKLSKNSFSKLFYSEEGSIPYLDERYNCFHETIDVIYNNKYFYDEIYSIKSDIDLLNYIVNNFNSFNDYSIYRNRIIHFNKRATLLVNDLYYGSSIIHDNLGDVNNLGGCADYGIPRTFRDYGILVYKNGLDKMVDSEELIEHNSDMEISIRASMLYVIEIIKNKLREKDIITNSVELDNIIWNMGRNYDGLRSNVHHTVTIYY